MIVITTYPITIECDDGPLAPAGAGHARRHPGFNPSPRRTTMTPIHTYANPPTRRGPTARFSASARPIPPAPVNGRTAAAWFDPVWATTLVRAKITATVVAILAMVVLLVAAPPSVTLPLVVALVTMLFVGGTFLLVERLTRPSPRTRSGS
jgi:hypothetical protein